MNDLLSSDAYRRIRTEGEQRIPKPCGVPSDNPKRFVVTNKPTEAEALKLCGYWSQLLYGRQLPYSALVRAGIRLLAAKTSEAVGSEAAAAELLELYASATAGTPAVPA